jgi:hypothetical protein
MIIAKTNTGSTKYVGIVESPIISYGAFFVSHSTKRGITIAMPAPVSKNNDRQLLINISDELLDRLIRYRNLAREGIDSDRPCRPDCE